MTVTRKRHFSCLLALIVLASAAVTAQASVVATREFDSRVLARKWSYVVYLPDEYATSGLRYPVFYLLHGSGQTMNAWSVSGRIQATADALIASRQIPPAIIVMPEAGTSWYLDRQERMETAVIEDLLREVEENFRTVAARNGRVIGGVSMGGYGALRFALKYPEKFAAAALLSPAIYDPEPPAESAARRAAAFGSPSYDADLSKRHNYPRLWDAYLAKQRPVPMYIDSGDDDEYMIEYEAAKLYALLRKHGQPAELRIVDGAHEWKVWEATIGEAMKYVLRYVTRPQLIEPTADGLQQSVIKNDGAASKPPTK